MKPKDRVNLCMIIGDPADLSLSPIMHNPAYKALGIDNQFKYELRNVKPRDLAQFMNKVKSGNVRGISVTLPHKVAVMQYLDWLDPAAQKIGAVNTIVIDNGLLKGYNTDWLGIVIPLENISSLQGKKVGLIGAGGAARAVAYGLASKGALITIYNRRLSKAQELVKTFGGNAMTLDDLELIKKADIIINATPVGMYPHETDTPLNKQFITSGQTVFDIVYAPYNTRLLKEARQQGAEVIHGTEMLLHQGMVQFKLYTGMEAPERVMREALIHYLKRSGMSDAD